MSGIRVKERERKLSYYLADSRSIVDKNRLRIVGQNGFTLEKEFRD